MDPGNRWHGLDAPIIRRRHPQLKACVQVRHTAASRATSQAKAPWDLRFDEDVSPAFALLKVSAKLVADPRSQVRGNRTSASAASEARRRLRHASQLRWNPSADRHAHLMLVPRATDELDSNTVLISHSSSHDLLLDEKSGTREGLIQGTASKVAGRQAGALKKAAR